MGIPAREVDFVSSQVDVLFWKYVDGFFQEFSHEGVGGVSGRIDRAEGTVWLVVGVASGEEFRKGFSPGAGVSWGIEFDHYSYPS